MFVANPSDESTSQTISILTRVFSLNDLPDEILLKLFSYLGPKDLGRCLQVSKRFNQIAKDMRLWRKITLWNRFHRRISAKFFNQVLDYGLENLELGKCSIQVFLQFQRNLDFDFMALENQDQSIFQNIVVRISNQKLSLNDLPDEILIKIFMYLRPKYLGRFRQVSKRLNQIAKDKRLWQKITIWNKFSRRISANFFAQALDFGLENLELRKCEVKGILEYHELNQLKSLNLQWLDFYKRSNTEFVSNLTENCQFLENLFIKGFGSLKLDFQRITINGQSLKKINISFLEWKFWYTPNSRALNFKAVKLIVDNCTELSELSLSNITRQALEYLCQNLTPKICKLHLGQKDYFYELKLHDTIFEILTKRCDKLTTLSFGFIVISILALSYMKNLSILEKLSLYKCCVVTNVADFWSPYAELSVWIGEFAQMTTLKVLCFGLAYLNSAQKKQMMQTCEQQLSHLENLKLIFVEKFKDQKILMDIAMPTGSSNECN